MEYTHRDIAAHLSRHAQLVVVRLGDDAGSQVYMGLGHVVIKCEARVKRGEEALWDNPPWEGFGGIWVALVCPVCSVWDEQLCQSTMWQAVRGRAANKTYERMSHHNHPFHTNSSSGDDERNHLKDRALRGASVSRRRRREERGATVTAWRQQKTELNHFSNSGEKEKYSRSLVEICQRL